MSLRIGVISAQVFPCPPAGYSGLEMVAWQCAKGLAALGHRVSLYAPDGSTCPGAEVVHTGPPGQWDERRAFDGYWKRLFEHDVIIEHSWLKHSYLLKEEGVLTIPVLGVLHAPVHTHFSVPPSVEKPCFVCISKNQATVFKGLFDHGVRVAYNGIDLDHYKPLNIPRTDRYLFMARYSRIKGPALAIQACRAANVGLDLLGDDSITGEPQTLAECRSLADGKQWRMMGPCSRGETVWWFSQAHGMLHPNKLFNEPFGLAPIESQACGTPVIGWRRGSMEETVCHGETGFLVDTLEEMTDLIKQDAVRSMSRERCREWASQFSVDASVRRYEELCVEAVQHGGW